jgi:hypothetical protein
LARLGKNDAAVTNRYASTEELFGRVVFHAVRVVSRESTLKNYSYQKDERAKPGDLLTK